MAALNKDRDRVRKSEGGRRWSGYKIFLPRLNLLYPADYTAGFILRSL